MRPRTADIIELFAQALKKPDRNHTPLVPAGRDFSFYPVSHTL